MSDFIKKYSIPFTTVSNAVLQDKRLSLKAKGMYAYLYSKPDGWQFHNDIMQAELHETAGQIRTIIKELIDTGYIKRTQFNENGKFGGMIYEFVDITATVKRPCAEKTVCGKTCTHNNIDNINNTDTKDNIYNNISLVPQVCGTCESSRTITEKQTVDWQLVVEEWNKLAERWKLAKVRALDDTRKKKFIARLKDYGKPDVKALFADIGKALKESPFLCGVILVGSGDDAHWENREWRASFDFFLQASSFQKTLEGVYADPDLKK